MSNFLDNLLKQDLETNRYQERIEGLKSQGLETNHIEDVVSKSIETLDKKTKSFVIYGEPQSGKTEMMICLTAKLLDAGHRIIVLLLNDSVQLLSQNLERFQKAGLDTAAKEFSELITAETSLKIGNHIIFCKKNSANLKDFLDFLKKQKDSEIIVIDDEADYATPNSKVNKDHQGRSKINELTGSLIEKGKYIGVTATPARLDLNRTHDNESKEWIEFKTHSKYNGYEEFFPLKQEDKKFLLELLPEEDDNPKFLKEAIIRFVIRVSYMNISSERENYSFLCHTSGKKDDHLKDHEEIQKFWRKLESKDENLWQEIEDEAKNLFPEKCKEILEYIFKNKENKDNVILNSQKDFDIPDRNNRATNPRQPFTFVYGGNIVSRGITFKNLLSFFFTRNVKGKLSQDTYIQRARMFGVRGNYLKHFELTIPKSLYQNWLQCFVFHRLSLDSRRSGEIPVWYDGKMKDYQKRIQVTGASSIKKSDVHFDKGEMLFSVFEEEYYKKIEIILGENKSFFSKIESINNIENNILPDYLVNYLQSFKDQIAISPDLINVSNWKDVNKQELTRGKGFIGKRDIDLIQQNDSPHLLFIINNQNKFRFIYKCNSDKIRILKSKK